MTIVKLLFLNLHDLLLTEIPIHEHDTCVTKTQQNLTGFQPLTFYQLVTITDFLFAR
jgi:hypothetical protein